MSARNPFEPPEAVVADIGAPSSRGPLRALVAAGCVVIALILLRLPNLFWLVERNVMNPVAGLLIVLGTTCLAIGLWRASGDGLRGRKSFVLAIVFLALALSRDTLFTMALFAAPFVLAIAVALAGIVLAHARLRARRQTP